MPVIKNKGGVTLDAAAPIDLSAVRPVDGSPEAREGASRPRTARPAGAAPSAPGPDDGFLPPSA